MSATISENYLSRAFTLGVQSGRELVYDIRGATDENAAAAILSATAPSTYQSLRLDSLSADPLGGNLWKGYARYLRLQADYEYTFETGGGTQHITQSIGTVSVYAPAGYPDPPDFKGAIGVSEDKVEGVDVVSPQYQFTETHYFTDTTVTTAYKVTLAALTGRTNNATFKGFAPGEVLFLGANGSKRGDENWQITFRFGVSPNATGIEIGGTIDSYYDETGGLIPGIDKRGWDYLWVRYADFEDTVALALVKQPVAVYVEQVYYEGNLALLGIGT